MRALHHGKRRAQNGLTLIELLVALAIGIFLLGGLGIMVQNNKRTFSSQNQLAQLQDSERLAMTMMSDVIQSAGYFPNPTLNTATSSMVAAGSMGSGQALIGTTGTTPPGDTLTVRYATTTGDGILNCSGLPNTTGSVAPTLYTSVFSVVNGQLICNMNGVVYPLVGIAGTTVANAVSVTNLSILYGVNSTGTDNNVDSYMTAAQVTAAAVWNSVISMQVSLTFTNPLYSATAQQGQGTTQPQTITFTRDIGVMNKSGIQP
ncbi:MAG TPA: PilW family protein [Steroidobacteraceae bacterium]|jgi:type IV pilus assembly protein PilW